MCRHKQIVHKVLPQIKPFLCSDCDFEDISSVSMKKHFLQKYGHIIVNHCFYCNIIYRDGTKFLNHAESVHSLPTKFTQRENADIERIPGYKRTETGSLQCYQPKRKITSTAVLEVVRRKSDARLG